MAALQGNVNTSTPHLKRTDYVKRMDSSESSTSSWDLVPNVFNFCFKLLIITLSSYLSFNQ